MSPTLISNWAWTLSAPVAPQALNIAYQPNCDNQTATYVLAYVVYSVCLHPLTRIQGPWQARVFLVWLFSDTPVSSRLKPTLLPLC